MGKIYNNRFRNKTAQKTYPLGRHIPYMSKTNVLNHLLRFITSEVGALTRTILLQTSAIKKLPVVQGLN